MLKIFVTLLMIAIVIAGVVKKYHTITVLFSVSMISLLLWSLSTGQSALGEETCGNLVLDVFEYVYSILKVQFSGTVLTILSVLGYVGFMNKIRASDAFTVVVAKPLSFIRNQYVLLGIFMLTEVFLKLVIPSAISLTSLLLAILYPIFLKVGCSRASIVSAFVLGTCITWGPADAGVALTVTLSGKDIAVSDYFMDYQFLLYLIVAVVIALVFVFTAIYFDKKENAEGMSGDLQLKDADELKELGVPLYYAVLPLLPMMFILLFSGKIIPITLSTVGVVILSISIALIVHMLNNLKTFKKSLNDIQDYFGAMGNFLGGMGFLVMGGAVFAGVIGKIGGMTLLVETLNNLGGGAFLLAFVGALITFVVVACTGSYTANLNVFVPFFVSIAEVSGFSTMAMCAIGNLACGLGTGLTPVSGTMLFLTGTCKVNFATILKRNVLPLLAGLITLVCMTFVLF